MPSMYLIFALAMIGVLGANAWVMAVNCEYAVASCNANYTPVPGDDRGVCCTNHDEDARIIAQCSGYKSCMRDRSRRCGELMLIEEGLCGYTQVDQCGGDIALGGCDNVLCNPA
jgi:hypothetical protein